MKRRQRKQKTPQQMRKRANRRQRIGQTIGKVFFAAVLVSAAVLALTVFFKVDAVDVEGAQRYTADEIRQGLSVHEGDNLYLWNKVKVSNNLLAQFPYLESVQIRRSLPDRLTVSVTECAAALAVPTDGGYYYISRQGKVLELNAADGGLPLATGVTLMGMQPGELVDPSTDAYTGALLQALNALDAADMLPQLKFINLQSLTDIRIGYMGRFDIRIGTLEKIVYRLRFAQTIIDERLSPSDIGRLYWDAKDQLHFVPDSAENVEKSKTTLDSGAQIATIGGQSGDTPSGTASGDTATGDTASGDTAAQDGTASGDEQTVDGNGDSSGDSVNQTDGSGTDEGQDAAADTGGESDVSSSEEE